MTDPTSTPRSTWPGLSRVAWAFLLLLPGCFLIGTSYRTALVGPLLAATALATLALVLGAVRVGVSRWAAGLLVALALVLAGYVLSTGGSFVASLTDAVPRLLTAPAPAPATGQLVAPAVLLTGLVTVLVAVRLTTHRRADVSALVGGVVLYLAGALLTSGSGDRYGLVVAVLALIAVGGWALIERSSATTTSATARTWTRSWTAARGTGPLLLAALPVLALVVIVGSVVPRAGAFEPRRLVTPPVDDVDASSPLPQISAWNQHPAEELMRVRGDNYPLRMVTLTNFDGTDWRAATRYRPLGGYGTAALPPGQEQVTMKANVRIVDLPGSWLPSYGLTTSVSDGDALIDPETGSTLLPGRADHLSYTIQAQVDAPNADLLPSSVLSSDRGTAPYVKLPELPEDLRTYARVVTKDQRTPYGKAKAIERAVQGGRTVNPSAITGSSYWRLQEFLLGKAGTSGAQNGTSEQFAAAFAVLARSSGLPTRLVVGFRPGTPVGGGFRSVRGSDAFAWPEVYFEGLGWVAFSPTPDAGGFSQPDPATQQQSSDEPTPSTGDVPAATGPDLRDRDRDSALRDSATWPWYVGGGVLILVLLVGALVLARRRRRARNRTAGPAGAWQEVLDAARLVGIRPDRSRPASEAASDIDARAGGPAAGASEAARGAVAVATGAERAVFGPDVIRDGSYWDLAVDTTHALRNRLPWWRRALWSIDPRPLLKVRTRRPRR